MLFKKEVSEAIGAVDRDTDIIVSKTNIWETPSSALLIQISACDVTTDWSSFFGSLSIDTADKKEGIGSLKNTVATPVDYTFYDITYDPAGTWDLFAKKHILFELKCDRVDTDFLVAYVCFYDALGKYVGWDITFPAGEWKAFKLLISSGLGNEPDLASLTKFEVAFMTVDTIPFYVKIDNLRVIASTIWADNKIIQEQEDE